MDDQVAARRQQLQAAKAAQIPFDAFLTKDGAPSRLFRIDRLTSMSWRCETWDGPRIRRSVIVSDLATMEIERQQFAREVAALEANGWRRA